MKQVPRGKRDSEQQAREDTREGVFHTSIGYTIHTRYCCYSIIAVVTPESILIEQLENKHEQVSYID